ncbi:MAG: lipase class 2 [Cyanobacteria bacterium RYN_339]|nr:lipase class 2 [Cyanobacteria bacterium RYN_339]
MHARLMTLTLALATLAGCGRAPVATQAVAGTPQAQGILDWTARLLQADADAFKAKDANGDGTLTVAELPGYPAAAFTQLDTDHDGKLTRAEATAQGASLATRAKVALEYAAAALKPTEGDDVGIEFFKAATPGGNPVLLVPGYLDLKFYFGLVDKRVKALGRSTTYVQLFPNIGDIRLAAGILRAEVQRVKAATGASKVDLVAHSEGGLIARYYIQELMETPDVERLVTLATPYHGTVLGYIGPGQGANQMQPKSTFLNSLKDHAPDGVKTTSIRAGLDEIIVPHDSPILAGADNELVQVCEHASIFVSGKAWGFAKAGLQR